MVGYVEANLKEMKFPSKKIVQTMLVTEEVVGRLVENAGENEIICVEIGGILGNIDIRFRAKGTAFDSGDIAEKLMFTGAGAEDEEANNVIKRLVEKVCGDNHTIDSILFDGKADGVNEVHGSCGNICMGADNIYRRRDYDNSIYVDADPAYRT